MEKPKKSMEFCLDVILTKLEGNYKNGVRIPLNAQELLTNDFQMAVENHEFFKRMIKKLIKDGYAEFKDPAQFPNDDALDFYKLNTMLTVEGYYFIADGGYVTEKDRNESYMRQIEADRKLTREVNASVKLINNFQKWSLVITGIFVVVTGITAIFSYQIQSEQYKSNLKDQTVTEKELQSQLQLNKTCRDEIEALTKELTEFKKKTTYQYDSLKKN